MQLPRLRAGTMTEIEGVERVALPPMGATDVLKGIEKRLIQRLAYDMEFRKDVSAVSEPSKFIALGLAEARSIILGERVSNAMTYVADMNARIRSLSSRQRNKLWPHGVMRESQQKILEGEK